jgi:hypothetical protein
MPDHPGIEAKGHQRGDFPNIKKEVSKYPLDWTLSIHTMPRRIQAMDQLLYAEIVRD